MKYKGLAVFIENKSKDFYQVVLTEEQENEIADFISQIQGGTIKVRKEKIGLKRQKQILN